jgi:hypothetical protein
MPLKFDHRRLPAIGFHFTPKGKVPGRVVNKTAEKGYYGHAYVIEPSRMRAHEFEAVVEDLVKGLYHDSDVVILKPGSNSLSNARNTRVVGHPIKGTDVFIHKEATRGYRGDVPPGVKAAMERGEIDLHIGNVSEKDLERRKNAVLRVLKKYAEG